MLNINLKEDITIKRSLKKSLAAGGAIAAVALSVAGAGMANAATTTNGQSNLVDKLVAKFSLNKEEVQKVFDEDRAAHKAEREAKMKERLSQAVTDGKLTQAQADALEAKQKEMKAFMESLKDKTAEERHAAMKTKMDEFKQWLTDNGITGEFGRFGMGHGHRGPGGPGGPPPAEPSADTTSASQVSI